MIKKTYKIILQNCTIKSLPPKTLLSKDIKPKEIDKKH